MFTNYADLADRCLAGEPLTREDALAILSSPEADLLDLVAAAGRLRRAYFGNTVKANYLVNLKSGLCPEDCNYCSQRLGSTAPIEKYSWLKPEQALEQAQHGIGAGATRVCLVSSGRGPSNRDVERVGDIVSRLKEENPNLEVCACLGFLKDGQAEQLHECGVDAYNHNVNTAESRYDQVCSTHTYADRVDTITKAKNAGLSACSGLIVGMGESDEQIVEALFALVELKSDSIPVNFLMPFEGTPFSQEWSLTPSRCLRVLALARFAAPTAELRIAGGREMHLRSLQPLALHVANSIFLGDYLTSEGQATQDDVAMIRDGGFVIVGSAEHVAQQCVDESSQVCPGASSAEDACGGHVHATVRHRGAGTSLAPNA
ncbi:biotin synthase BioB [Dermatophilus congolensis]|uniref:Biotin synthase n=1 Tax=Dermatophilus congolensis TaxID=1863 RepID=A0A239VMJ4_9MICO|nr:biotin synthase BioB [Dermatophilus congolensis]MBO3129430.1 biotin synthase BioB [Dermatophilus congolensis]MBO3131937.1 biotin synthase BioB [Dermatophilus congolensis]MBO3133907.1 biotin synthase BioB [Dermatophilus congolensis]MBO3136137.1 biotin synthase BioB [Dermatophilus congolensis]MBO3138382.1 biotin synthase BioB [Dermatophilus congolensis]